jgi:tRNA(Ile)-lysidine synthase
VSAAKAVEAAQPLSVAEANELFSDLVSAPALVLAVSGGPDSTALLFLAARWRKARKRGPKLFAITVDHGLREEAAAEARQVARLARKLGVPHRTLRWTGAKPKSGLQEKARAMRYRLLTEAAAKAGASHILTAHTLDDQAETVLLGLARGSGARSLAGMAPRSGRYLRPLLDVPRAQTEAACAALGLSAWADPQNSDAAYARVRVRARLLPALETELGPGVSGALARTARQLRADADTLDELAAQQAEQLADDQPGWSAAALAALPDAIRGRVLRQAALAAGARAGALSEFHVVQVSALVTDWHGQQGVDLPGGVRCQRRCGRLHFAPVPDSADPADPGQPAYKDEPLAGPPWEGCSGRE